MSDSNLPSRTPQDFWESLLSHYENGRKPDFMTSPEWEEIGDLARKICAGSHQLHLVPVGSPWAVRD